MATYIPQNDAEKEFADDLHNQAESTLGPHWRTYWPRHVAGEDDMIAHRLEDVTHGTVTDTHGTVAGLVESTKADAAAGKDAVIFFQRLTIESAIQLGAVWQLDPQFFIEHIRTPEKAAIHASLVEGALPNTLQGLKSTSGGDGKWAAVRGVVDHGRLPESAGRLEIKQESPADRRVHLSKQGRYLSHTNMSYYKVGDHLRKSPRHPPSISASAKTFHRRPLGRREARVCKAFRDG